MRQVSFLVSSTSTRESRRRGMLQTNRGVRRIRELDKLRLRNDSRVLPHSHRQIFRLYLRRNFNHPPNLNQIPSS